MAAIGPINSNTRSLGLELVRRTLARQAPEVAPINGKSIAHTEIAAQLIGSAPKSAVPGTLPPRTESAARKVAGFAREIGPSLKLQHSLKSLGAGSAILFAALPGMRAEQYRQATNAGQ